MTTRLVLLAIPATLLFNSCGLNQQWEDDDVYVVKEARTPTDADISDETDYSTFTSNLESRSRRERYYEDAMTRQAFMLGIYTPLYGNYANRGWGYGYHYTYNYGWGSNPYYMFGCSPWQSGYGYYNGCSGFYNPYWGYNPYGYNNWSYNNGYGSPTTGTATSGIHVRGPRGSSGGYGGVSSRSSVTYKSSKAPADVNAERRPVTAKPVTSQATPGRTSGRVIAPSSPSRSTATAAPGRSPSPPVRATNSSRGRAASEPRGTSSTVRTTTRGEGVNVSTPAPSRSSGSGSRSGSGSSGSGVSRTSPGRR